MTSRALFVLAWLAPQFALAATFPAKQYSSKPDVWYESDEAAEIAAKIRSHQATNGLWPKNIDTSATLSKEPADKIKGTFDNSSSTGEIRFMARAYSVTKNKTYLESFEKGLEAILTAQYPNGGWPQSYPPVKGYGRHITYNDNSMVNLMELVREVATSKLYAFVPDKTRRACKISFDQGVACILATQVKVDGVLTVWCAQHDEKTLEPRPARAFELVSLSGAESAGILRLLMSIESPSPPVLKAIDAGCAWFERVRLTGIRQDVVSKDKQIVADPTAPPLWARFYEIGTDRPFFCGRDGVKKYDIREIESERRNGYAWYGTWGTGLLEAYGRWKAKRPAAS